MSRTHAILAFGVLVISLTSWERTMAQSNEFPSMSVVKEDEVELPADPSFSSACMKRLSNVESKLGWRFGRSILTRSKKWGLIWRVDLQPPEASNKSTFLSRIVCWRASDEDEIGYAFITDRGVERLK